MSKPKFKVGEEVTYLVDSMRYEIDSVLTSNEPKNLSHMYGLKFTMKVVPEHELAKEEYVAR